MAHGAFFSEGSDRFFLPKLISVSSFMARWGRNFFHKFREKIKKHKETLASLVDCTDEVSVQAYMEENSRLNELLLHEEVYWKQRAKMFWLTEGDENTKFFHASATTRKKTNHVDFLINDEGIRVEGHEAMCKVVHNYFSGVFSSQVNESMVDRNMSPRTVTSEQNSKLVEELNFDEFTLAVKQMHPDKASGPDGLNPAFFQNFWALLGHEVFNYCKRWLDDCIFPAELNNTNIVLIPKKEGAFCMKDLRRLHCAMCSIRFWPRC